MNLYPFIDAIVSSTAFLMVMAALLEALLPIPTHWRLSAFVLPLSRLGHKVNRLDSTPDAQRFAGLLAILVVWLPTSAGIWAMGNLAVNSAFFDLLLLLLLIESRPLTNEIKNISSLLSQPSLAKTRQTLSPWLKRECHQLSAVGITKAITESMLLRLVGQWAGPLLGYALMGVQGALIWRLTQLMNQGWSVKDPQFTHFGRYAMTLYQLLNSITSLLLSLPLLLPYGRQLPSLLRKQTNWPYKPSGVLLTLLAIKYNTRLGGPRYYHGTLERWSALGQGEEPTISNITQLYNTLYAIGWCLLLAILLGISGVLIYG